jgi:hypothetical protein
MLAHRRESHVIRNSVPLLLAILVTASCSLFEDRDYRKFRLERSQTETWDAAGVQSIDLSNVNGRVTVRVGLSERVAATITRYCTGKDSNDADANIDRVVVDAQLDSTLTIKVLIPNDDPRDFGADMDLRVPHGKPLTVESTNGTVMVVDLDARMDLTTTNGDIAAVGLRDDLTATSTNGRLNIDMAGLTEAHVLTLASENGWVVLGMPDSSSARFNARTTNGAAVVHGFSDVTYTVNEPNHKEGIIGTGASFISATSTNGDVSIEVR